MGLNFFFYLYSGSVKIFINYDTLPKEIENYYWSFENSYGSETIFLPYGFFNKILTNPPHPPPPPIHLFFLEELHQLNATFKKFFIAIQAAKEASITFFIDYGETKTAMLINGNAIAKNINS